jgi:hypothetical protein
MMPGESTSSSGPPPPPGEGEGRERSERRQAPPLHHLGAAAATPVGVTLAHRIGRQLAELERLEREEFQQSLRAAAERQRRRQGAGASGAQQKAHRREESAAPASSSSSAAKGGFAKKKKKSNSLAVFLEGAGIYILCLVLPTVLGYLANLYLFWREEHAEEGLKTALVGLSDSWSHYPVDYLCEHYGVAADASSWTSLSSWVSWSGLCPSPEEESDTVSVLSRDTDSFQTDMLVTACLTVALAVVRILIVRWTVPLEESGSVQAMVRCKSIHLLSHNYSMTPTATPTAKKRPPVELQGKEEPPILPDLGGGLGGLRRGGSSGSLGLTLDESERQGSVEPTAPWEAPPPVPPTTPRSSAATSGEDLLPSSSSSKERSLYAAPRYATALFRLLYSATAAVTALYLFRDADFWPWYVGGSGSTAACWDLSGGLSVGMDSDFDHRNAVLKRYFLGQASYHWHSGAFHILSMLLLLQHPDQGRFLSVKSNSAAYVRSMVQHLTALALIGVAYVFSSLRRLGAIGMFAFDVSSWFLHLLQVCINAPDDSRWKLSRQALSRMYWWAVLPSFFVTRVLIWPALWWSVVSESDAWMTQLERTLWPGSADLLRGLLHAWAFVLLVLTAVYFRRLLNHSHLKGILRDEKV